MYCFVSNLSVVYFGDLFTCTQQMHWGIYVPVRTNFLMIVCFECKQAASKVVCIVLFLIYLLCTRVTCLPVHSRCTGAFMCLCEVTFLVIVCFECKRAASKVVSIILFLIYLLCTWVTCLPVHSRCTGTFMCLCEVTF